LQTLKAAQIHSSEAREIVRPIRGEPKKSTGINYLLEFALSNFYFHTTTTYAILRHAWRSSAEIKSGTCIMLPYTDPPRIFWRGTSCFRVLYDETEIFDSCDNDPDRIQHPQRP
jgi:hypothetical protein